VGLSLQLFCPMRCRATSARRLMLISVTLVFAFCHELCNIMLLNYLYNVFDAFVYFPNGDGGESTKMEIRRIQLA
jgi:hypothetical protein